MLRRHWHAFHTYMALQGVTNLHLQNDPGSLHHMSMEVLQLHLYLSHGTM